MSQTKLDLMIPVKNHSLNLECSVCYKKIYRDYFVCSAPCNKVFHVSCMEKMMNETKQAAYEADEEPQHKCCYCRRSFDRQNYLAQLWGRHLIMLRNTGYYDVSDAWCKLQRMIKNDGSILFEEHVSCEVYELRDITRVKKPKQANLKKKQTFVRKQPRVHVKQNIGGRRRS